MVYDLIQAIKAKDLWLYLGYYDVMAKYKRTYLGPIWSIIITIVSIGCMAFLGAALFKSNLKNFLPYVACGIVIWVYLSSLILE